MAAVAAAEQRPRGRAATRLPMPPPLRILYRRLKWKAAGLMGKTELVCIFRSASEPWYRFMHICLDGRPLPYKQGGRPSKCSGWRGVA